MTARSTSDGGDRPRRRLVVHVAEVHRCRDTLGTGRPVLSGHRRAPGARRAATTDGGAERARVRGMAATDLQERAAPLRVR
jgi:hypothetical protein